MGRLHTLKILCALGLPLFLLGCERTKDSGKVGIPSEAERDPVLKADDDARTIVIKAVKAHGGEKSFTRWSCGYLKYKTKGGVVPAQFGEVTVEDTFQLPGHFKRVTRMDDSGKELLMVFVVNHGKGWTKKGDAPVEQSENNFTEKTEHPFAGFCSMAPLADAEVRLTLLGTEKVNGKNAIGIRAQSEKLDEVDFYFGSQSGLLLRSRKLLQGDEAAKPSVMEVSLDDYMDVQGTMVPMRIKGSREGKSILDVTLIDARFADKFDESSFTKP